MIIVFGSIYMNLNMRVKRFPDEGGTSLSSTYAMLPGGKAANQSLAGARTGAKTALVGCVGDDGPGLRILQSLKRNGVMTSGVAKSTDFPTGIATIVHNTKTKDDRTFLALGANALINADQAPHDIFRKGTILLTQLEVPLEQNAIVMKSAHDKGAQIILNATPATAIPLSLLSLADYLIINENQVLKFAQKLKLDINADVATVAGNIAKKAKLTCVVYNPNGNVMLKSRGGEGFTITPNSPINMVDASGAEDCFCGTFAACLHEDKSLTVALRFAATAYALSCADKGAQESYPYLEELTEESEKYGEVKPI